jgi:vacuolar-type H+-ATPase catalytic subunit A/Vma1
MVHMIMLPPGEEGKITKMAPAGQYTLLDVVLTVRALSGRLSGISVFHSTSVLHGGFAWARSALNGPLRRVSGGQIENIDGSTKDLTMMQHWPVRSPRPYAEKMRATEPLLTCVSFLLPATQRRPYSVALPI